MKLEQWRQIESRINAAQIHDAPALLDRLPRAYVEALAPLECLSLKFDPRAYLRGRQLPPSDPDWLVWALITGRSWGKSFGAAGWIISQIMACTRAKPGDFMLVAPSLQQCEDLQWSVIASLLPPWVRAVPRLSHQQVLFPELGARIFFQSAENAHARGKNLRGLWGEEIVAWPNGGATLWKNLMRSLRVPGPNGEPARAVITTTPPVEISHWLLSLLAQPTTRTTRGTARDNPHNSQANIDAWYAEDSNEARRENEGLFVFGIDGALFALENLERHRVAEAPPLDTVVVSVDPASSDGEGADPVGISVIGFAKGHGYLLASKSERMSPDEWPRLALEWGREFRASRYIVESTGAGQTAATLLRQQARFDQIAIHVDEVKAKGSKAYRAGPLANAAANGRFHLVGDAHEDFIREATGWYPGAPWSPGAIDAVSHAWAFIQTR